jgi:serine/threonine-protein kinase
MGEVWRARDTRLGRDVAIKVLTPALAGDAGRMARLSREAQVLAALNQANIAAIYGLEESEGAAALVMELVEGQTIDERIRGGRVPVDEAVAIARQMTEALEAAHEKGIVHRDLKPANIKVTHKGKVKVLDFGLAKAFDSDTASAAAAATNSPTLTIEATRAGQILGTAAYMSPEQARGKAVDKRADIWAFGLVLYEMLVGKPMFEGETVSDILADVLRAEIDLARLPAETPAGVRRLLVRCLRRNPNERLRDIGDARIELDAADDPAPTASKATGRSTRPARALAAVFGSALVWVLLRPNPAAPGLPVTRWTYPKSAAAYLLAVSRDGSRMAFTEDSTVGASRLQVRQLDQLEGRPLPETEGGAFPVFSPDGQWILYSTIQKKIRKVAFTGGPPIPICDGEISWGASWGDDDTILYSNGTSLLRVAAAGGAPERVLAVDPKRGEFVYTYPQILPGSKQAIFTIVTDLNVQQTKVGLLDLRTKTYRVIANGGGETRYVPSGHLVYYRGGSLFALPFDLQRMAAAGTEAPVILGVAAYQIPGSADYAFSDSGLLVYVFTGTKRGTTLAWMDRKGAAQSITTTPQLWGTGRLSPDGTRVANTIETATGEKDIWVLDTARATTTRLTTDGTAGELI